MLLTAQYWVKAAGPPLILQGYIPAGAPGGAWSKVRRGVTPQATKKAAPGKRPGRPAYNVATLAGIWPGTC